jgi:hypothetical protein
MILGRAVKVSLAKQNIYVMEGDRCLMAVATTVGIPEKPTPKGNFTIYSQEHKLGRDARISGAG